MNYERSKAPLALMEQIIMILVFALAAAVCLQAYVYADQMSKSGQQRERASARAREVIEYCKATGGDLALVGERLDGQYEFGVSEDSQAPAGAAKDGIPMSLTVEYPEDEVKVVLSATEADRMHIKADVTVYDQEGKDIFSTRTAWQIGGQAE